MKEDIQDKQKKIFQMWKSDILKDVYAHKSFMHTNTQVIKGNLKRIKFYFKDQIEERVKQILWVQQKTEPHQSTGELYGSSNIKGEREDNRDSVETPVNLIAENGELLKSYIDFPSQACRAESKSSD